MTNKANFNGLKRVTRTGGIVLRKIFRLIMSSSGKYTMRKNEYWSWGGDERENMYDIYFLSRRLITS